jgi:hypothetical protein
MALNKLKYSSTTPVELNSLKVDTGVVVAQSDTNTFLGYKSQKSLSEDTIIEGPNNTGIGYATMTNNPSSQYCTAIGSRALAFLQTGNFNTAVGARALENLSTGDSNTAIGTESLVFITTGSQNTALGFQSLAFSNASSNVAVGYRSLFNNSIGSQNVCMGTQCGFNILSSANNVAIGFQTLFTNISNGNNTAVGSQALALCTGNNNTALGRLAGFSLSTGSNNTFIGNNAGSSMTTGSNSVIIGAYSGNSGGLDIRTSSGDIVLSDGFGSLRLHINSSGILSSFTGIVETSRNNFNTSLAPSSGTLTIDTSLGNIVLGDLSASVTTWAFTNVFTINNRATTVTLIIDGDTAQTYGDACTVNGSAVSGGVKWSGGTAPTATNNFDILTFVIVRDGAGTINVFGSGNTNFS